MYKRQFQESKFRSAPYFDLRIDGITPVSYTHLDVYKRQVKALRASSKLEMICPVKVAETISSSSHGIRDLKVSKALVRR